MATAYQKLPVPGFDSPTAAATDPEILYSTAGFTQKGITIAGGQGVLLAGTAMAQRTTDKKYYPYAAAGSEGRDVVRGILRRSVDTGAAGAKDQLGNLVIQGIVKLGQVVGMDAAGLTDIGGVTDTVRGTLKF